MGVELATIARADDMKKVKNVNVWPQAVDDVVFGFDFVSEYEVVLTTSDEGADVATVRVSPNRPVGTAEGVDLVGALRDRVGIGFEIETTGPGELRFEDNKARRWRDLREHLAATR
jgi:phenylacetate-CoA ligase